MSTTDSSHSVVPICLLHYSCSNHYTWTLSSLQCCLLFNNFSVTGDLLRYKTPLLTIFIMFFMLFSLNYHSFFILKVNLSQIKNNFHRYCHKLYNTNTESSHTTDSHSLSESVVRE